jgi:methyl-accepting chemotaxis protein
MIEEQFRSVIMDGAGDLSYRLDSIVNTIIGSIGEYTANLNSILETIITVANNIANSNLEDAVKKLNNIDNATFDKLMEILNKAGKSVDEIEIKYEERVAEGLNTINQAVEEARKFVEENNTNILAGLTGLGSVIGAGFSALIKALSELFAFNPEEFVNAYLSIVNALKGKAEGK